jgi:hypothetical protein
MKFYVYKTKPDTEYGYQLYFVAESKLLKWASLYNPDVMEYVGVSLNASSEEGAKAIYLDTAKCIDQVMTDEEPAVTKVVAMKQKIGNVSMDIMVQRLAKLWLQVDEMLRAMAAIHIITNKDQSKEEAYIKLKQSWLKRYLDMP